MAQTANLKIKLEFITRIFILIVSPTQTLCPFSIS